MKKAKTRILAMGLVCIAILLQVSPAISAKNTLQYGYGERNVTDISYSTGEKEEVIDPSDELLKQDLDLYEKATATGETRASRGGTLYTNVSEEPVQTNATQGAIPEAASAIYIGKTYYFNLSVTSDIYLKSSYLYIKPYGSSSYTCIDSYTAGGFFRYRAFPYTFTTAGEFSYYWVVEYANSSGVADGSSQTLSTHTLTVNKYSMVWSHSSYTGVFDGAAHSPSIIISEPSNHRLYYSTTTALTSSNYSSYGTTTKPTRTESGSTKVYWFALDLTGYYYNLENGAVWITITPDVYVSSYNGTYNGSSHKPTLSILGGAKAYYSTGTPLSFSNYTSGTTVMPSRTNAGTTTVYYCVVPNNDATSSSCVSGSTEINISKADTTISASNYSGTYDGASHSPSISVSGPSSYSIYYSTTTPLTSSNYNTSGSTTKPTRTNAGQTTVYYYVKDNTGNYTDKSGTAYIYIKPNASSTAYNGTYDGSAHSPTITATGGASLYYSSSIALSYSNYNSYGSTTMPSRTAAGTTTVYYIAVPTSNPSSSSCSSGSTSITIGTATPSISATNYTGEYDSGSHSATITVSGPSSYTVYYSTTTSLTSSNYTTSGSTTKPTRTNAGQTTVYYYVKDKTGNYSDKAGTAYIRIQPKVVVTAYSGTYDGAAHSASIAVSGAATLYYSTTTALTFSNYQASGSTTIPARTQAGTTTVYYIAVPNANATSDTCTTGQTTITVNGASTVVTTTNYSGTYDGQAHAASLAVSGPSSYSVYYSTTVALNSSNFSSSGSTTVPTRTNAGETTVYYFVKDNTGNYGNKSGSMSIFIKPNVSATGYSGTYNGSAQSATISATGGATLYYSTAASLTFSNYSSSGSTTMPTRTTAGTTTVYYIAVPTSNASSGSCTSGSVKIAISPATTTVNTSNYSGTYDGSSHSPTFTVTGSSNYTIYYSTSTALTSSNYSSAGTTTKPTRADAGQTTVYAYVKDSTGNYTDATGAAYIYIRPRVVATAYSGTYDGAAHSASVTATGNATLYFSTSSELSASNYSAQGTTTIPSRSNAGITTVYYIAVPNSGAVNANVVSAGNTTISINGANTIVAANNFSGTYDGNPHSIAITVSGPSSYTVYYSTSTALSASNYAASGSTTVPTRTNAGQTTVYYYVKDSTGNYGDKSGTAYIYIKPRVSATAYTGTYDGLTHSATITAQGGATLYYSVDWALTAENYATVGSTTAPSATNAGVTTVYYAAVPTAGAVSADVITTGSTKITINKAEMTVTATSYVGIYNAKYCTGKVDVIGPTAFSIFYSDTESLDDSNYTNGSNSEIWRLNSGESTVYYYVEDSLGNYRNATGSFTIQIKPAVTAIPYAKPYDGAAHGATVTAAGAAKLYYSTTTTLSYGNYLTAGSTTVPTLTNAGTTTVFYIAVPNDNPTAATSVAGSTGVSISPRDIGECNIQLQTSSYTYDGQAKTPPVIVTDGAATLIENVDYSVQYSNNQNAGEATAVVEGKGNYSGSAEKVFLIQKADQTVVATAAEPEIEQDKQTIITASGIGTIQFTSSNTAVATVSPAGVVTGVSPGQAAITVSAAGNSNYNPGRAVVIITVTSSALDTFDIAGCTVTLSQTTYTYDGSAKTPDVTVQRDADTLKFGIDYLLSYHDNTNAGTGYVTVTGCGLYANEINAYFVIEKAVPEISFEYSSIDKTEGDAAFTNQLSCNSPGNITYSSDAPSVVEVNAQTGEITIVARGSATITAIVAETANYKSATASFTVNVAAFYQPKELTLQNLTYSFVNNRAGFGYPEDYMIPLSSYQLIFGETVKASAYYAGQNNWGGNCNGMASTSALLFDTENGIVPESFDSTAEINYELDLDDEFEQLNLPLLTFIEAMQISQRTELYSIERGKNRVFTLNIQLGKANLNAFYQSIEDELDEKHPAIIAVCQYNSGHALLAYRTETVSSTENRIYVYDCNYPNQERFITLKKNSSGDITEWSYEIGGSYGVWGTQNDTSSISYISYSTILDIWNNRGNLAEDTNVAHFNTNNIAIYDVENKMIATVIDGQLLTSNPRITIVERDMALGEEAVDDGTVTLRLPIDVYTVKNLDDSIDVFEVSFIDTYLGATVSTTADSITLAVDDSCNLNAVFINAGESDTYSVTLNSSYEYDNGEVCVEGSGSNETLEVSQTHGNITISNCNIGSITVDGVTVHVYEITATSTEGGILAPEGKTTITEGANVRYALAPDTGYRIGDVLIDGESVGAINSYTFENVQGNHTIHAVFERIEYEISATATEGGTITPSGIAAVAEGASATYSIAPNSGYAIKDVLVDEQSVGAVETYTFENVTSNHTIHAIFEAQNHADNCPGSIFTDMPPIGNWAHDAIDWAIVNKITAGTSATTFSPNAGCTRAQVVTFLWRAAGEPEPTTNNNPFSDVKEGTYYYKAVLWAVEKKVTAGTSATTFSPDTTCTRAQIVTFLWRYEGEPAATTTVNPFADVKAGAYYEKAVLWASETGVTAGTSATTFSPENTCTRAQVVTFLFRDIQK